MMTMMTKRHPALATPATANPENAKATPVISHICRPPLNTKTSISTSTRTLSISTVSSEWRTSTSWLMSRTPIELMIQHSGRTLPADIRWTLKLVVQIYNKWWTEIKTDWVLQMPRPRDTRITSRILLRREFSFQYWRLPRSSNHNIIREMPPQPSSSSNSTARPSSAQPSHTTTSYAKVWAALASLLPLRDARNAPDAAPNDLPLLSTSISTSSFKPLNFPVS